ncbi:MAG: dicarboxylate/amino acid:cation symporter [Myxococcota bacterium]
MHWRMLAGVVGGAALGVVLHALWPDDPTLKWVVGWTVRPIGQVFLRLLFALVLPLVFCALALGVAELGHPSKVGRVGLVTLLYTAAMSLIAVAIGVGVVNGIQPGLGVPEEVRASLLANAAERASAIVSGPAPKSGVELLVRIVPDNLVRAMADNDMIAVMFAATVVGIGLTLVPGEPVQRVRELLQGVYDLAMWMIGGVLKLAPFGVFALMTALTAELGLQVLTQLGWFVATVLTGLALHQFVVIPLAVVAVGRRSPVWFFRGIQDAMLTAFSTASSSATLPTTLRVADELGLPPRVSRFVLTVGATANQNGTALFEGVTVLFLAQFYGVELSVAQQLLVASVCVLGGIGTAGVPAGSLPVVAMILGMIGVPVEGIGLVLGVDRLLDMCRTTLNVSGDLAAAVVAARFEGPELTPR